MNISNRKSIVAAMLVGLIAFTLSTLDAEIPRNTAWVVFASAGLLAFYRFGWKGFMGVLLLSVVISDSSYGGEAVIGALSSVSLITVVWMFGFLSRIANFPDNTTMRCVVTNKPLNKDKRYWEPADSTLCLSGTPIGLQSANSVGFEIASDMSNSISMVE